MIVMCIVCLRTIVADFGSGGVEVLLRRRICFNGAEAYNIEDF